MTYAQPPNLPDFSQVTYTSLQIIPAQTQAQMQAHTVPQIPPHGSTQLSPVMSSPHCDLWKYFVPILWSLPCASLFCTPKPTLLPLPQL